jgi:hypothetical protein
MVRPLYPREPPSLEGQAGGVHEDDAEFGEQVAPTGKQPLLRKRSSLSSEGLLSLCVPERLKMHQGLTALATFALISHS